MELNLAVGLFEKAAKDSDRAKRSLPTLLRLREKAHNAARQLTNVLIDGVHQPHPPPEKSTEEDELLIFAGKKRLVQPKPEPVDDTIPPLLPHASSSTVSLQMRSSPEQMAPIVPSSDNILPLSRSTSQVHGLAHSHSQHRNGSPSDGTFPPTPDDSFAAMNTEIPGAWSAWSDQEALLINYLSSGVDMHLAQNAAFPGEVSDSTTFMWENTGNSNTPEATSPNVTKVPVQTLQQHQQHLAQQGAAQQLVQQQQQHHQQQQQAMVQEPSTPPSASAPSSHEPTTDYAAMYAPVNTQHTFVNVPESGLGMPSALLNSTPGMTWDMFF